MGSPYEDDGGDLDAEVERELAALGAITAEEIAAAQAELGHKPYFGLIFVYYFSQKWREMANIRTSSISHLSVEENSQVAVAQGRATAAERASARRGFQRGCEEGI